MKRKPRDLTELHREQLVDIGGILRDAREARQITHEAIAEKILIRASLLRAMEAADVQQLPEPVYTRGLLRQYANALGLDGDTLSSQYFTPPSVQAPTRSFWRIPLTPQLRPVHLYLFYVLLISAAVSGLSYTLKQASYRPSALPPLQGEAFDAAIAPPGENPPEAAQNGGNPDGQPLVPPAASSPVRVAVEMQDQSWLRITTDGEVAFEGVLKEGDARTWTADEQLVIRAGNAGGVVVSFNEGAAKSLGKPGVVTEVAFPPNETARLIPQ
jgi:cytoskeletal protein RodZ